MANYVINRLTVKGSESDVNKVLDFIKSEDSSQTGRTGIGTIDFNKIIPMPENIYRGNICLDEKGKYGKDNWYDWSIENWGTKWNALRQLREGNTISFETAWSPVLNVVRKLASIFPDVELEYEYSDENFGYNVGMYIFKGLEEEVYVPNEGSKEAYELAIKINGYKPSDLIYDESIDNYTYL